MTIHELDTPALIVELDILERNLAGMAAYADKHGLRLRPHTKTHKSVAIARRQLALGAAGLTVAKPGEAEVMAAAEPPELLVAYPTIGARKLARLAEIAKRTRLNVALDSMEAAQALSAALVAAKAEAGVLTEADVGLHRVGVTGAHALAQLIEVVQRLPNLVWDGIAFYPGHIKSLDEDGLAQIESLSETVAALADRFLPRIVSGGSTPTWAHSHRIRGLNEIRPGTYVFNDRNSVHIGSCEWEDCAASILTTVVSTAQPGQVIVDGGSKTFSSDRMVDGASGFGAIPEDWSAEFHKMNEEHGFIKTERRWRIGDRIRIIPNHICVAVNLHERVFGVRGETVEEAWGVDARGKLQ
jgi:D-serine deaminase-like pyridoxal phosphate-dependent protein